MTVAAHRSPMDDHERLRELREEIAQEEADAWQRQDERDRMAWGWEDAEE